MRPRPLATLVAAFSLGIAALAPAWTAVSGPSAAAGPRGVAAGSAGSGVCCGDMACCERGGGCGTGACADMAPAPGSGAAASTTATTSQTPTTSTAPAAAPIPADCPRLSAGCRGAAPALLAGAFDPMIRDESTTTPPSHEAEPAIAPEAPAPYAVSRDPQEPPPRA